MSTLLASPLPSSLACTHPFLADESALSSFLAAWENGTLPRQEWTHAAHVAIAAYYSFTEPGERAFVRMKEGILRYNAAVDVLSTPTSGYHETLTRFWVQVVTRYLEASRPPSLLEAVRGAVTTFGKERHHHRAYYSFDVVRDIRARLVWIEPDLQALDSR